MLTTDNNRNLLKNGFLLIFSDKKYKTLKDIDIFHKKDMDVVLSKTGYIGM